MFNYTKTALINSNVDEESKLTKISGSTGIFKVLREGKFLKENITAIYKQAYVAPVKGKVVFTFGSVAGSTVTEYGTYNLNLYVELIGDVNSNYANALVKPGKPLNFGFDVTATMTNSEAAASAQASIKAITTYYGDRSIVVTRTNNVLTIEGTEFTSFRTAFLERYDSTINVPVDGNGDYVVSTLATAVKTPCVNGFGNYYQIMKNLRLETYENNRWLSPNKDEMPIVNATYNEYIIVYRKERGVLGGEAMGQMTTSQSTHVFYVNTALASAFETALANVALITVSASSLALGALANATASVTVSGAGSGVTAAITTNSDDYTVAVVGNTVTVKAVSTAGDAGVLTITDVATGATTTVALTQLA